MTGRTPHRRRFREAGTNGRLIRLFVLVVAASVSHVSAGGQTAAKIDPADPLTVPRITLAEFRHLYAKDAVLAVDVRTELEFSAGRIPGAVNVPVADADKRVALIRERAAGRPVVFYCSCPSEHSSAMAALAAYAKGVTDVRALVGGYPEWVKSGGKIER